jgi:hypothetical protein
VRFRAVFLLLALALGSAPAPAWAAPGAAWRLTPAEPRVGDRITARLEVTLPAGARADWQGVAPAFGPLVPEAATDLPAVPGPDGTSVTRAFVLYADLPGTYHLPRVPIPWRAPDGAIHTLTAAAVDFAVAGAFDPAGPAPPPAPAKPPVGLPLPAWVPVALAGAGLAMALLAWAAIRRLRRRPPPAPLPRADTPPHEAALARLAGLDPDRLPLRDFYGRLSEVARAYLEDRFGLPAPRRTTAETRGLLAGLELPAGAPVAEWLAAFDLVKFAKAEPSREEARAHLEAVRRWVAATARER